MSVWSAEKNGKLRKKQDKGSAAGLLSDNPEVL